MAQESCNLDKDEAEILKPSSSSSPSPSPSSPPPSSSSPPSLFLKPCEEFPVQRPERPEALAAAVSPAAAAVLPAAAVVSSILKPHVEAQSPIRFSNRCSTCQKKVGLTGFRCRCGDLFCGRHRYSDIHDCSFDYKAAGREEIAKANPVVRAAKIIKI